jgi:hypothetical protein
MSSGAGYVRRYLQDPGLAELLAIEGVVIIDREPAAPTVGEGTGVVCLVGEFEKGDYKPLEVFGGNDVLTQFGAFGFTYNGIGGNNPCARSRKADGVAQAEYWNGNGYIALVGKKYSRLILTRVDTSVGNVSFTRLAYLQGGSDTSWNLEPAQALTVKIDGSSHTITWAAAAAIYTGSAGSYPYAPAGGETLTIVTDYGTSKQVGPVVVTFTAADTTQAAIMARINAALGYACATDGTGGKITFTGLVRGTGGSVNITQVTTATGTAIGVVTGSHAGTGDVANIDIVTFAEVKAKVEGGATGSLLERGASGELLLASVATTGTPKVEIVSATTTVTGAFGFPLDTEATPISVGVAGTLPAGVIVTNTAGDKSWTTTQDLAVSALSAGPYVAKVRPTLDDGTAVAALPGAVTTVAALPGDFGVWAVTNVLALTAALTESALDAAYVAAIDKTKNPNSIAIETDVIISARQSNTIRMKLRSNALESSSKTSKGRSAIIRPPLGITTRAQARGDAQPGVGGYRDQRVWYAYPGVNVNVPQIAALGVDGGAGFTADGNVDVGSDTWLASICSQLPPEEDPGQQTTFGANALSIEVGNPDVQTLEMEDYEAFKRAGIVAPRMAGGVLIFQSGVTSVDPIAYPGLVNIARRRMADFIQASLADALMPFSKKITSRTKRAQVIGVIEGFLGGLVSAKNPDNQRIDSYTPNYRDGNTRDTIAAGLFRAILKVRTLSSFKDIVLDTEIGEGVVTISQTA